MLVALECIEFDINFARRKKRNNNLNNQIKNYYYGLCNWR